MTDKEYKDIINFALKDKDTIFTAGELLNFCYATVDAGSINKDIEPTLIALIITFHRRKRKELALDKKLKCRISIN